MNRSAYPTKTKEAIRNGGIAAAVEGVGRAKIHGGPNRTFESDRRAAKSRVECAHCPRRNVKKHGVPPLDGHDWNGEWKRYYK